MSVQAACPFLNWVVCLLFSYKSSLHIWILYPHHIYDLQIYSHKIDPFLIRILTISNWTTVWDCDKYPDNWRWWERSMASFWPSHESFIFHIHFCWDLSRWIVGYCYSWIWPGSFQLMAIIFISHVAKQISTKSEVFETTKIYYLNSLWDQKSRYRWTWFYAQGLKRLKSMCHLSVSAPLGPLSRSCGSLWSEASSPCSLLVRGCCQFLPCGPVHKPSHALGKGPIFFKDSPN